MRIGTTPTHTFTLPYTVANTAKKVRVIYKQADEVVITKDITLLTGEDVIVKLTQEETLQFHHRKPIEIQLQVLTDDGNALTSDIITRMPYEFLGRSEVFE